MPLTPSQTEEIEKEIREVIEWLTKTVEDISVQRDFMFWENSQSYIDPYSLGSPSPSSSSSSPAKMQKVSDF